MGSKTLYHLVRVAEYVTQVLTRRAGISLHMLSLIEVPMRCGRNNRLHAVLSDTMADHRLPFSWR